CSTGVGPYQPCIKARVPGKAEGPDSLIHNGKDLCTLEALDGEGAGVGEPATAVANTDDDSRLSRRRTRGQPEAPPLPGQRDISKPQITLPPQIQELLDGLTQKPTVQNLPEISTEDLAPETLLDYLLAP
ncbi:MAG: hypothetical protein ACRDJY_04015, partial [Thermoleophilaceae bacterium]